MAGNFESRCDATLATKVAAETVRDLHSKMISGANDRHWSERAGEGRRQGSPVTKAQAMEREVRLGVKHGIDDCLS